MGEVLDVDHNEQLLCTAYSDLTESLFTDSEMVSCSCVVYAVEGKNICKYLPPTNKVAGW